MKVKLNLTGSETEIEIARHGSSVVVKIGDRSVSGRILQQEGPSLLLALEQPDGSERLLRVAGVAQGDKRQLWVNGRTLEYQRLIDRPAGSAATDASSLSASIPSVVTQVLVEPGDEVATGDKLILLESMKMIMPIQAPYDGRVTAVLCQPGEAVQPGVPLIEIQPL
jgi:biotin carboxyl carrier protein